MFLLIICSVSRNNLPKVPIENYKGTVISDKHIMDWGLTLKIQGKKQEMQEDSFYYQYVRVNKIDYEKYNVNDTVK